MYVKKTRGDIDIGLFQNAKIVQPKPTYIS